MVYNVILSMYIIDKKKINVTILILTLIKHLLQRSQTVAACKQALKSIAVCVLYILR